MIRVTSIVIACHLVLLLLLEFQWDFFSLKPKKARSIHIQTVTLNSHLPTTSSIVPPNEPVPVIVKQEELEPTLEEPAPKPEISKKESIKEKIPQKKIEKKVIKKTSPVKKPTQSKGQKELLREARESLAKISETKSLPKETSSLKIENESTGSENVSYQDELALHLKVLLQLPEYGDVKVRLTIKRDGTLLNLKVLQAESKKNQAYLEGVLKNMNFPTFGSYLKDNEHTFTITLSNET